MRIELPLSDDEDPLFLQLVGNLLAREVLAGQPERIYCARMNNWFGGRWYGFCGKLLGAAGVRNKRGNKDFILPPFVPNRVLSETSYERTNDGNYRRATLPDRLAIHQEGGKNLRRSLACFTENGLLLWYSGNSRSQDMASTMMYVNTPPLTNGWYLGVRRERERWHFHQGIEITKRDLEEYNGDLAR